MLTPKEVDKKVQPKVDEIVTKSIAKIEHCIVSARKRGNSYPVAVELDREAENFLEPIETALTSHGWAVQWSTKQKTAGEQREPYTFTVPLARVRPLKKKHHVVCHVPAWTPC